LEKFEVLPKQNLSHTQWFWYALTLVVLVHSMATSSRPQLMGAWLGLFLGALILELRSIRPGDYGQLSCAAAAYVALLATPKLGPMAALPAAVVALAARESLNYRNWTDNLRSALADLIPLAALGLWASLAPVARLQPVWDLVVGGFLFLAFGGLAVRVVYPHDYEARTARRRFLIASLVAAIPLTYLVNSSPMVALFLFPLLLVVQYGGYGFAVEYRREQLQELSSKLKRAKDEFKGLAKHGQKLSKDVEKKEVERGLIEDFSKFFASNPSGQAILDNLLAALERLFRVRCLVLFRPVEGLFLPQKWAKVSTSIVGRLPARGLKEPLLAQALARAQILESRDGHAAQSPALSELGGSSLALPLGESGVIFLVTDAEMTERQRGILVTIASQVVLGLESARYRDQLARALSQRTEALNQLEKSQRQLVQSGKMAAVGQLAAGVAHELNSPLAAVLLQIQSSKMRLEIGNLEKATRSLEVAERATNTAQRIIDKLLRFSHVSNQSRLPVRVDALYRDTLEMVGDPVRKSGVALQVDPVDDGLEVLGDPLELQQLLTNLLLNARDAAVANRQVRPATIRVTAQRQGDSVLVTVADSGAGMSAEVLERAFEPFFTTKEIGEGTGLGLSLAYQIVESHQGTIEARNSPEGGAVVTVVLPAHHADEVRKT
jgi:signal transduction histidine kinase